jgi:hypothetical protein
MMFSSETGLDSAGDSGATAREAKERSAKKL